MDIPAVNKTGPRATISVEEVICGTAVFLYWLFQAAVNVWWIKTDTRPPFWDTAGHATIALQLTWLVQQGNPQAAFNGFLSVGPYPPLMYVLSIPFALLFGQSVDALLVVNIVFLGILFFSAYGLGCFFNGPVTGLLTVCLLGMYPIIGGLSRHYLLDIPLTAMVTLAIYCLMRTEQFERFVPSIVLGAVLALGMLTKTSFAMFVAGPLLVSMLYVLTKLSWRKIRNLFVTFLIGGFLVAPWYIHNLARVVDFNLGPSHYAALEGDPAGNLEAWLYYGRQLINEQLLAPFVVLFLAGLILLLRKRKLDVLFWAVCAWMVVPYLVSATYANKDARYTLPYVPAIALITAAGFSQVRNTKLVRGGIILVALYALVQFAGLSFGLTPRLPAGTVPSRIVVKLGNVPLPVYSEHVHIASPPVVQDWKVQDVLDDMMKDATGPEQVSHRIRLVVIPNSAGFEAQGFIYFVQANSLPVDVSFVTGVAEIDSSAELAASDYVVSKSGDQGPSWTVQDAAAVTDQLQQGGKSGLRFTQIGEYALPDGSVGRLYRHLRNGS